MRGRKAKEEDSDSSKAIRRKGGRPWSLQVPPSVQEGSEGREEDEVFCTCIYNVHVLYIWMHAVYLLLGCLGN